MYQCLLLVLERRGGTGLAWIWGTLVPTLSHIGSNSGVITSDHIIETFLPASSIGYNLMKKAKSSNLDTERYQA